MGTYRRTFKDANSSRVVVDATGRLQGSSENLDGGNKVIGEAVVQVTLEFSKNTQMSDNCSPNNSIHLGLFWRRKDSDG